jgi:hypothetical protein
MFAGVYLIGQGKERKGKPVIMLVQEGRLGGG